MLEEPEPIKRDLGIHHTARIHKIKDRSSHTHERRISQFGFGPVIAGKCRYAVDRNDALNALGGFTKRIANATSFRDPETLSQLARFTDQFCNTHYKPLSADTDTSIGRWIAGRNYTVRRKEELAKIEVELQLDEDAAPKRDFDIGMFIKDEHYGKPKAPRGIANVSDPMLIRVGKWIKLIEQEVFHTDAAFVKHVPVSERAEYVSERLGQTGPYFANDFTSWEGLQTPEILLATEFRVYRFMLKNLGGEGKKACQLIERLDTMERKYRNDCISLIVEGKRKSGSAQTSLGNGLVNRLLHGFFSEKYVWDSEGCFEGDDSVFNDPHGKIKKIVDGETKNPWQELGVLTKLELHHEVGKTSFCGNVFDQYDRRVFTEPMAKLLDFAWMPKKYLGAGFAMKMQLLRSKALSLAYAYRGQPILTAFAHMVLRLTRGYRIRDSIINGMDTYAKENLQLAMASKSTMERDEPTSHGRWFVDEMFGISIREQLALEEKFDQATTLEEMQLPNHLFSAINSKATLERTWDNHVEEYTGQKLLFVVPQKSIRAMEDFQPVAQLIQQARDTRALKLLPANYNYRPFWTLSELEREERRANATALAALKSLKSSI